MHRCEKFIKAWQQTLSTKSNEIFIASSYHPYDTFQTIYDVSNAILASHSLRECSPYEFEKVTIVSHI